MTAINKIKTKGYVVAYRNLGDNNLPYTVIPNNNINCWAADPFIFVRNGVTYIFAELYSFRKNKGCIGYCTIVDGVASKWKVIIEEEYHLSYPNIFEFNDDIYICPESNRDNSVYFYKAVQFPDKWEKSDTIISGKKCADTTFLKKEDQCYGFTYDLRSGALLLFKFNENGLEFSSENPISYDLKSARPAGNILNENGRFIRVSQNGVPYYGYGLVFSEMTLNWPHYSEDVIKEIYPESVKTDKKLNKIGIHTYNRNQDIEVIDLQIRYMSIYTLFWRVLQFIKSLVLRKA